MVHLRVVVDAPISKETSYKRDSGEVYGSEVHTSMFHWHCSSAPNLGAIDAHPLQWTGGAFGSTHTTSDAGGTTVTVRVDGLVSADARTLVRLTCRRDLENEDQGWTQTAWVTLHDVPLTSSWFGRAERPEVRRYVSGADYYEDTANNRWRHLGFDWDWTDSIARFELEFSK